MDNRRREYSNGSSHIPKYYVAAPYVKNSYWWIAIYSLDMNIGQASLLTNINLNISTSDWRYSVHVINARRISDDLFEINISYDYDSFYLLIINIKSESFFINSSFGFSSNLGKNRKSGIYSYGSYSKQIAISVPGSNEFSIYNSQEHGAFPGLGSNPNYLLGGSFIDDFFYLGIYDTGVRCAGIYKIPEHIMDTLNFQNIVANAELVAGGIENSDDTFSHEVNYYFTNYKNFGAFKDNNGVIRAYTLGQFSYGNESYVYAGTDEDGYMTLDVGYTSRPDYFSEVFNRGDIKHIDEIIFELNRSSSYYGELKALYKLDDFGYPTGVFNIYSQNTLTVAGEYLFDGKKYLKIRPTWNTDKIIDLVPESRYGYHDDYPDRCDLYEFDGSITGIDIKNSSNSDIVIEGGDSHYYFYN